MLDPELTLAIRNRPPSRVAISMSWRDLLFLHFPMDPYDVQQMLPKGLTVDTFPDENGLERAWIGLVPFRMEGVRPRGVPTIRACSDFPETNVRTYCHSGGEDPGVWFFSLDAANPAACAWARAFFGLNYREAKMSVSRAGDRVDYASRRWWPPHAESRSTCLLGAELGQATPGTLEFFLVERYLLYSQRGGRLHRGQVFHAPYRLREVPEWDSTPGLITANGFVARPFIHAVFSSGVDVVAGRMERV